jgi:hypothetical protein
MPLEIWKDIIFQLRPLGAVMSMPLFAHAPMASYTKPMPVCGLAGK